MDDRLDRLNSIIIVPTISSPLYPGKHPKDDDKIVETLKDLEQIEARIRTRAMQEIHTGMSWWDRVQWARGIVKEHAPAFVEQAAGWSTMSNADKKQAVTEMLLLVVKILEKYVNIIPGYMEPMAWMFIRRSISSIIESSYKAYKSAKES